MSMFQFALAVCRGFAFCKKCQSWQKNAREIAGPFAGTFFLSALNSKFPPAIMKFKWLVKRKISADTMNTNENTKEYIRGKSSLFKHIFY